jgi:hypothetical protein
LPDLNGSGQGKPDAAPNFLQTAMQKIGPVKQGVDMIMAGCKSIVQSGIIPGAEHICSQIVALATGLLPMAAQNLFQPGVGGPPPPPGPDQGQSISGGVMPPPPGPPPNVGQ